jgi:LysM repeat protein
VPRARKHQEGRHGRLKPRRNRLIAALGAALSAPVILVSSVLLIPGSHAGAAAPGPARAPYSLAAETIAGSQLSTPGIITVGPGQTLSGISASYYGTARYWPFLAQANHLADPDRIYAGERLAVPLVPRYVKPSTQLAPSVPGSNSQSISVAGSPGKFPAYGVYSYSMLEAIWEQSGGPAWAAPQAASIALCESGGRTWAHNPSGAAGLWQIDGAPEAWAGSTDWLDARVNALAAVDKFRQAGDSFSPWVCQLLRDRCSSGQLPSWLQEPSA